MLLIKNAQAEPVRVVLSNISQIIEGNSSKSFSISKELICFEHINSFENSCVIEKTIGKIAKSFVLVVDSRFLVDACEDAIITINNGVFEHSSYDFGYLYFNISTQNCTAVLKDCKTQNCTDVLRIQKAISISEAFDFFPISLVTQLIKYKKIKKLCCSKEVFKLLSKM